MHNVRNWHFPEQNMVVMFEGSYFAVAYLDYILGKVNPDAGRLSMLKTSSKG